MGEVKSIKFWWNAKVYDPNQCAKMHIKLGLQINNKTSLQYNWNRFGRF